MKKMYMKILFLTIPFFLTCGCAKQSFVETSKPYRQGKEISIFFTPPQNAYKVISVIESSAFIDDFKSLKDAEAAALKRLMDQAEKVGADGVIEVYREFLDGGEVVSSTPWEEQSNTYHNKTESVIGGGCGISSSINFNGKAIKFED
ncbi:MAG: hypothetical protein ACMUIU_17070 [bacterium]